jgi:hypothetical protein
LLRYLDGGVKKRLDFTKTLCKMKYKTPLSGANMTQDKTEPRKILLPPKKKKVTLETSSIIPATELLLHDAKAIIGAELAHYRSKAVRGVTLDPKEARIVQGYLESLVKIQREEREISEAQDLSALSDSELMRLAKRVLDNNNNKTIDKNERSENESE